MPFARERSSQERWECEQLITLCCRECHSLKRKQFSTLLHRLPSIFPMEILLWCVWWSDTSCWYFRRGWESGSKAICVWDERDEFIKRRQQQLTNSQGLYQQWKGDKQMTFEEKTRQEPLWPGAFILLIPSSVPDRQDRRWSLVMQFLTVPERAFKLRKQLPVNVKQSKQEKRWHTCSDWIVLQFPIIRLFLSEGRRQWHRQSSSEKEMMWEVRDSFLLLLLLSYGHKSAFLFLFHSNDDAPLLLSFPSFWPPHSSSSLLPIWSLLRLYVILFIPCLGVSQSLSFLFLCLLV